MFSLGVITFELLRSFGTGMQRVHEIQDLRCAPTLHPPGTPRWFPFPPTSYSLRRE